MFERILSLAKAQSAIGTMKQAIVSRLDWESPGLPALAGLGGPIATGSAPVVALPDRPDATPAPERVGEAGPVLPRHPVPPPSGTAAPGHAARSKGLARPAGSEAVFTFRSRLDRKALERSRPRERDDLIEFEALMEFAISRGVRRQAVDLSYLDTPVSIELTAMLPSFTKALRELRHFAQDHGWPVVTVAYGDEDEAPVARVMSPGTVDFG